MGQEIPPDQIVLWRFLSGRDCGHALALGFDIYQTVRHRHALGRIRMTGHTADCSGGGKLGLRTVVID